MFKIGEFSRFSRVSVKMLRHYDEIGLLKPAHVDAFTNYRYYSADQLPRLHRIIALKDLGFALEQIRTLIDDELSTEQMRGMLKLRRSEIARQLHEQEQQLARVEARLDELERTEQAPPYDVVVRTVPDEMVASIRQTVEDDGAVTELFETLEAWVARYDARAPRPPLLLYHDDEYHEEARDLEVAVPVRAPLPGDDAHIAVRELKGHDCMACLIHTGRYDSLPAAFGALLRWIDQHDHAIVGPVREVYLRFGAAQQDYELPDVYLAAGAAEFVTELQIPISSACADTNRQDWLIS
ncbi:MAG: MerR family transcriptional regulator [Candidatus Promineifilaceae bacterium]|nr:MerR family transcriptional regulator [Candidatus Promineifilaceae bacterium]